jgi:hypothetical protein
MSRSPGLVADFKQVRSDTRRSAIVRTAGKPGGCTVADVLDASGIPDRKRLTAHLFCLHRDCGFGYIVDGDHIALMFPGARTWRDAIRQIPEKAEKTEKKPRKKAA